MLTSSLAYLDLLIYQLRQLPSRPEVVDCHIFAHPQNFLRIFLVSRQHLSRPFCSSCSYVQLQLLLPAWCVAVLLKLATGEPLQPLSELPGRKHLTANLLRRGSTSQSSILLGGEGFPAVSRGYVCRKCYNLLNGYCERRKVVFHNIDQAIEVLKQGTASDTTRDSRARKIMRTSEAEHSEPAAKSPRLADDGREQVSAHTYFLMLHCPAIAFLFTAVFFCGRQSRKEEGPFRQSQWASSKVFETLIRQ